MKKIAQNRKLTYVNLNDDIKNKVIDLANRYERSIHSQINFMLKEYLSNHRTNELN